MYDSKTYTQQVALGNYCKTGENEPKTSIQKHTYHYRRLISNIFVNIMSTSFPISKHLLGAEKWKELVLHFMNEHKCQSPQVWKMPKEFSDFYQDHDHPILEEYPLLRNLFVFEWLEIEVYTMPDEEMSEFTKQPPSVDSYFVPNPEIRVQVLEYPFHKKPVKQITEADKGSYIVTIHRDYHTKKVMYNEITYPFLEMLLAIHEGKINRDALQSILANHEPDLSKQEDFLDLFVDFMIKNNLILGYHI